MKGAAMKQRPFGRTVRRVSEIGLGGHREGVEQGEGLSRQARFHDSDQSRASVIAEAIDCGVTYFDTTFGCEIASLGRAFRLLGRREGLFVSGVRVDFFSNYLREGQGDIRRYTRGEVEGRLREFGFEHIEQFLLGALESGDPLAHPGGLLHEALDELDLCRKEGKIAHIGFSCHDSDYAARLLEAYPAFESVMTPYNFANRQAQGNLAAMLRATGKAWIAMKPLVWHAYGIPVTALRNLRPVPGRLEFDPFAPIAQLALRWILANPLVTTTVPAVNSIAAVRENAAASGMEALTPEEIRCLDQYAAVMTAEDMKPLALAGMMEGNLRVRGFAMFLIDKFGLTYPEIDFDAQDAPRKMEAFARSALDRIAADDYHGTISGPRA
jgi:aryl-alcohol dehydrogenase-like predicted oxidoreductase